MPGACILFRTLLPLAAALLYGGVGIAANVVDRGVVYFSDNAQMPGGGWAGETMRVRDSELEALMHNASPAPKTPVPLSVARPVADPAESPDVGAILPADSMFSDLMAGMLPISPDEFSAPLKVVPMSLREVAASILRNNRSIQVASYRVDQVRADIMAAKAVYDPEVFADWTHSRTDSPPGMIISGIPSLNREFRNEVGRTGLRQQTPTGAKVSAYREWNSGVERNPGVDPSRGHGGAYVAEISQPLLNGFADVENRSVIEISQLQASISEEEFRQTLIETMADTMEAYWSVALAREDMRINEETLAMAERLLRRESGRKDQGISTQLDVNRAREAAATRAYNLMLSREQYLTAQEKLKYLLNSSDVPIGMEVYVDVAESLEMPLMKVNLEKCIDTAFARRPEMTNAELAIRTSETRRRYAKHSLLPELNLVGSVRKNDATAAATPTSGSATANTGTDWSMGVAFSMPIGNMKARANLRKANAEIAQTMEEKRNIRDIVVTEVRTAVKNMELIVREIPLNKRAVVAAAKVLEGEWAKLELNQTGNSDLLQAQDLMAVAERNHIQSLVRYNVAIVQLLAAEGSLLDRMGIKTRATRK